MRRGLLVEDDALFAQTLKRSLERRGLLVQVADDANGALALAASPFDFVLLDLHLGTSSGLALIGALRERLPQARIVLLTGFASVATAVEAIKRGADDYLAKPAAASAILRAIEADADEEIAEDAPPSAMLPLDRVEWEHIQQALRESEGNVSAAARLLGMHRRSLQRKLGKRPPPERR
jgi:two-component system response regulator RegA